MAVPPAYADLGKSARDIFSKGYGFGFAKLDVTTKTDAGVEFNLKGSSGNDTGKVDGSLELKYAWKDYGLSFKEKWNTDNNICAEVSIEDQIAQGLKLTFDTSFAPNTGKKTGQIKTGYKRDYVNLNADVDFEFAGPTVNGAAVVGYEGWLAGYQFAFDSSKSKLTKNNFALGYKSGDFQIHASVNDGADFGGSIYQKISENLEAAFNLGWTSGTSSTRFAAAAKYTVDKDSSISAKICNTSQVGLGYSHNLRDGVKLTLSALIDGKNLNQGGHKVGLGLEMKA